MENIVSKHIISRPIKELEGNNTGGGERVEPMAVTFNSPTKTETTDNQACRMTPSIHQHNRRGHRSSGSAGSSRRRMRGRRSRSSSSILCATATATHGSISVCGRRKEMEDTITIEPCFVHSSLTAGIENETFGFYAVYDGHGGSVVAQVCKDRLHRLLADEIHERSSTSGGGGEGGGEEVVVEGIWERMMKSSFMKMDEEINQSGIEKENESTTMESVGSTAVVAVVSQEKLIIANCGDSRAVLCCGGVAVPLSSDHKPNRPDELERVEAAGGIVVDWNGYRVLGVLATSRSIGDHYLKAYVISEPEVTIIERTTNDEFLILASDGLWDVISNEIACDVVRKCLNGRIVRRSSTNGKGNDVVEVATVLAELAMARGSTDNISVIIVKLNQLNRN